jgi:outer membrane immunogenic protein
MAKKLVAALLAAGLYCTAGAAMADGVSGGDMKGGGVVAGSGCTGGPFQGWYVGGHVGYADHDSDVNNLGDHYSSSEGGFTGGLLSGYNHQCGRLVVGIESDINYIDTDPRRVDLLNGTFGTEINYFGTERLRIGIAHDERILFYATGGLAYADLDYVFSDCCVGNTKRSDTQWGFTIGGGVEFLRDERWTLRAEALYVDLGSDTEHYTVTVGCPPLTVCTTTNKFDNEFWVARLGLTYRFGRHEEAAAPLK